MATQNAYSITALQIANPDEFRKNVRSKLCARFRFIPGMSADAAENAALNLERGIYNYTLRESDTKNIVKKWDNGYFVQIYADRLRTVCINLGNDHITQLIANKQIKPHELAFMTHQDMNPAKWVALIKAKQMRDKHKAVADTYGPKYVILVLDDYNQNHLNKGLVNIATADTRLSVPSYFTPGLACNCDASGNPTYVQSAPRQLTQAQLYTINAINQNRSSTTMDRYTGPTTTDVLALIPVKTFSMTTGQPYIEFGSSLQINERVYFGPVNIERMKVQLVDDKGNILNMHGTDWSFTIVSTHLYEY